MAPDSRRPRDTGADPGPRPAAFEYAVPAPPGKGAHYHVRIPDRGTAELGLAGGTAPEAILVHLCRGKSAVDGAAAVAAALKGIAPSPERIDPATAGGCGDGPGHLPAWANLRAPPPVRVVRFRAPAARAAAVKSALDGVPGLVPLREAVLGPPPAGDAWFDVHVVEE